MLVVLTLSSCPPSLRGDMTKWLLEIETGVYVGRVTARVKDMLWDRVIHSLEEGRAVLVHSSKSEQHFDILVHNSNLTPVDFDGITLMMRPEEGSSKSSTKTETELKNRFPRFWKRI